MTKDEILAAAKEAGLYNNDLDLPEVMNNFAAIIEKRTIERCAETCEELAASYGEYGWVEAASNCAAAIRALGEQ